MPNWCGCELLVTGSKKDLDEFAKKAATKKCPLDFNIFIPYPENWRKLDKAAEKARKKGEYNVRDGYNNGGYQWCIANWGTKWGPSGVGVVPGEGNLFYTFDTAWSPPNPVVKKMAELFPSLEFHLTFSEPGMCFHGALDIKKGVVTNDVCGEYVPDIEEEG